jgi:hypothetical protein
MVEQQPSKLMTAVRFRSPAPTFSRIQAKSFAAGFPLYVRFLASFSRRIVAFVAAAVHIAADDPFHLFFVPSQNFSDHTNRQSGHVEPGCSGSPEVVEV